MDPTEDLSARVLLKHILSTEEPRTPITRSASKPQSTSTNRRSKRLSKKDAGPSTPQDILRRSLRHKMRESIIRQSLPATNRRTASVVLRRINTPAQPSMLFDDGETPRHILMNILRTEPVKSPVVHEKAASEEPQPSSADSSVTRTRPSIELSGLDLPDITFGDVVSTAKGLSRKRPRRSLNVTAFERRLKAGEDVEEEHGESVDNLSSLSLSCSTSLSLKTPFVDVRTEKKGLQRRVSNRRKITEEEFGAAVNKRQMGGASSFVQVERGLGETAGSEGFTFSLSKLSEPDITTDILHCNTALYAQPDAMTSSFSIVANQDKPTVMASQLQQRQMEQEDQMVAEQSKLGSEKSIHAFPAEEEAEPLDEECVSQSEEDANAAEPQKEKEKSTAEDAAFMSEEEEGIADTSVKDDAAESEEEENRVEAHRKDKGGADSHTEDDAATRSQSEEEEAAADSQTKEEGVVESHTEEECAVDLQTEESVAARSQSEEEEVAPDSQTEEEQEEEGQGAVDLQSEEDVAARSQSEEEEDVAEYQSDQEDPAANSQSEEEGDLADSQPEVEHDRQPEEEDEEQTTEQRERDLEHVSRRSRRSGGGLIVPVAEAGWSDGKSKAHSSLEMGSHESGQLHIGIPDLAESSTRGQTNASYTEAEPDADKENSFNPLEATHDFDDSKHLSDDSPEEAAAAQDMAEQEEESEDEEDDDEEIDDIPSKTPAFVKQKILFQRDHQASPAFKNNQASSSTGEGFPAPKPKAQVRQKRRGPAKKEAELPKSYLMGVFKHFAKTKVSADVYPVLKEIMNKYFDRLAEDLETYAVHAKRKTIEVEDAELLLKRQGYVNDKVPVEVLIEKYLRMDQRKLLIPIATKGNVVIPTLKKRR
ncbi:centromere protein T isoform X1 [Sebastes umbrosus]|uniref:centromere protein T isoform X1 n=1 Tax=Sebastes umbrosus TaxID=72105 RepID=UPI0018A0BAA7|nr:centromere protein T isoform X1 [Sebastes umbrosus]